MVKQLIKSGLNIGKIIIVEGTISVINRAIRQKTIKDTDEAIDEIRRCNNIIRNKLSGEEPDDWDMI